MIANAATAVTTMFLGFEAGVSDDLPADLPADFFADAAHMVVLRMRNRPQGSVRIDPGALVSVQDFVRIVALKSS
jgi:hypothetical protein